MTSWCYDLRHYASFTKLLTEATTKTYLNDLLKVTNFGRKIIQRRISLAVYCHFKQAFPAPKQTKGVNIEDAQSIKLFH